MKSGYKIEWTKLAFKNFDRIVKFIENKWSEKTAAKFVRDTQNILQRLEKNPYIFQESTTKGIRRGVINRKTSFYYRIKGNIIRLITFWDNRENPTKYKL